MCPNVYCSMNVHQQQLTSWTASKADEPLGRMLAENGLLTRWNNRISLDSRGGALQGQIVSLHKKPIHEFKHSIIQYFKESLTCVCVLIVLFCPICVYWPIRVWDVPYAYTHMGRPYAYGPIYANGAEQYNTPDIFICNSKFERLN